MNLLVCEDEIELSNALCMVLKYNNYKTDAVYDGAEALEHLDKNDYDCVILDIMMPNVDGLTVLKTIRERGNNVPVIMLTAKSQVDDKVVGLDLGANDYLTKPFETKELLARIRAIVRNKSESSITDTDTQVIELGGVTLNKETFELETKTGVFRLARHELQLMELLMANIGKSIATQFIFDKIWSNDSDVDHGVVWMYISYLKKKLVALSASISIIGDSDIGFSLVMVM